MVQWIATALEFNLVKMSVVVIIWVRFKTRHRFFIWDSVTIEVVENAQSEGEADVHATIVGGNCVVLHRGGFRWDTRDDTRFTASCCSTEGKTCG